MTFPRVPRPRFELVPSQRHRSLEAEARDELTKAMEGEPVTIVDLLGTDEGADFEFDPERLGLTARSTHL